MLISRYADLEGEGEDDYEYAKQQFLWMLAREVTEDIMSGFRAELKLPTWCEGIYFLAPMMRSAIVVIDQLPATRDTLWLRLLGNEETQQQAQAELMALPPESGELAIKDLALVRFSKIDKPVERAIASLLQLPLVEALRLLIQLERKDLLRI